MWTPSPRYPDPAVEILDASFARYRVFNAAVERLATGFRWCEGPVWFGDGRYLLWSDIPNDRILRWDEESGAVGVFRRPSDFANGNTRDRKAGWSPASTATAASPAPSMTVRSPFWPTRFEGKRLNSPNDVVTAADGAVWFTDPPFGIGGFYEGTRAEPELPQNVYRLDPVTGIARGGRHGHRRSQRPVLLAGRAASCISWNPADDRPGGSSPTTSSAAAPSATGGC